jgi:hypothetical protein
LLSASIKSIQQSPFVGKYFAERTLPSAPLDKAFTECKWLFAGRKNTQQSPDFR